MSHPVPQRPRAVEALVVAAVAGAFILTVDVVRSVLGYLATSVLTIDGLYDLGPAAPYDFGVGAALAVALPFAVGLFVSFWAVAPVAATATLGQAIARGVVATAIGAGAVLAVAAVVSTAFAAIQSFGRHLFGLGPIGVLIGALQTGIATFLAQLALGILAAVLLWLWARRRHRPQV